MKRIMLAAAALLLSAGTATAAQAATTVAAPPGVHVSHMTYQPSVHLPRTHLQHVRTVNATFLSGNWSGYADVVCSTCALRYVAASFTLPSVNCAGSPNGAAVSTWVGLDGFIDSSSTVEQIGTEADCSGGIASYFAFYEMFPNDPVWFTGVNPGDAISASVYFNATNNRWQLSLTDLTNPGQIATSQACPSGSRCLNSSAEVITEAPFSTVTNAFVPLARFGQASYQAIQVTSRNGTRGGMTSNSLWTTDSITMVNSTGTTTLATPGPVYGGQAFQDTWRAAS